MSNPSDPAENADRLTRRRARVIVPLALIFGMQQASYFATNANQRADHLRLSAWVVMGFALLALLLSGGGWFRSSETRALMNDDVTRANRDRALTFGFTAAMGAGLVLYPFIDIWQVSAREAVHIIVSAGMVTALLRFSILERRSLA